MRNILTEEQKQQVMDVVRSVRAKHGTSLAAVKQVNKLPFMQTKWKVTNLNNFVFKNKTKLKPRSTGKSKAEKLYPVMKLILEADMADKRKLELLAVLDKTFL